MQSERLRITKNDNGWYIWDAVKGAMNISFEVMGQPFVLESMLQEHSDNDIVKEIDRLCSNNETRSQTLYRLLQVLG